MKKKSLIEKKIDIAELWDDDADCGSGDACCVGQCNKSLIVRKVINWYEDYISKL